MPAGSSGTNGFCSDSAGFNATGFPSLHKTFGWQGGVAGGTRTVNGDGSVTWQAVHAGSVFSGAIGSLSISAGSPNAQCPISTPEYSLAGGTIADGGTQIASFDVDVFGDGTLTVTSSGVQYVIDDWHVVQ